MNLPIDTAAFLAITCVHESRDVVVARMLNQLREDANTQWTNKSDRFDVSRIYVPPSTGGAWPIHAMVWTPCSVPDWTAVHVNAADGWSHLFGKVSQRGAPEMITIRSSLLQSPGGVQELIYRKSGSHDYWPTRILQWLDEYDGYRLYMRGEVLPAEAGSNDDNPISTRGNLLSLVKGLGIDFHDEGFWNSIDNAVYIDQIFTTADNISRGK